MACLAESISDKVRKTPHDERSAIIMHKALSRQPNNSYQGIGVTSGFLVANVALTVAVMVSVWHIVIGFFFFKKMFFI